MKITVSYINSKYDISTTIKKIMEVDKIANIHADLMDGIYVKNKNFTLQELGNVLRNVSKKIDVHLMTVNPEQYIDTLCNLNTNIIFFHPKTTKNPLDLIQKIKDKKRIPGIVINPNENISSYLDLYEFIGAVLIMSVIPGEGGQNFMRESLVNYELIRELRPKYNFLIYVDGGINDKTIKYVKDSDGVVVGSYICLSDDYKKQVDSLLISLEDI